MDPMIYELTVRTFYTDLNYDSTAVDANPPNGLGITYPQKITLYQNIGNFILRLRVSMYIRTKDELDHKPDQKDTDHVVIKGRRPDGTEITVTNISFVQGPKVGAQYTVVDVTNDPQIVSTLGVTQYVIQYYTADNTLICSGRFDITVVSATSVPILTKRAKVSLLPIAIPTIVHVSQNDINVKLEIDIDFGNAEYDTNHHVRDGKVVSGSSGVYCPLLEAKRPDGQKVLLRGSFSTINTVFSQKILRATFTLTNDFTNIPGCFVAQIRMFYGQAVMSSITKITTYTVYSEIMTSKINIIVEPTP